MINKAKKALCFALRQIDASLPPRLEDLLPGVKRVGRIARSRWSLPVSAYLLVLFLVRGHFLV